MKNKNALCGLSIAVVLQLGVLAGSAQTNIYLFSGSETNITLPPGTYIITAYGAAGAYPSLIFAPLGGLGGSGAEMSAEFNFLTSTNLTLLVGGGGGGFYTDTVHNGGGGGSFVVEGSTPLVIAGGGGGGGGADKYYGGNGNVSTYGVSGGGGVYGGTGGTDGGGGGADVHGGGGGGGGGFIGNGTPSTNRLAGFSGYGGYSFENGGGGGNGGLGFGAPNGGPGGYGGGGGGDAPYENGGGGGGYSGGGGGGRDGYGGGGGGSIIDSSAIAILAEVSGIISPYYYQFYDEIPVNGEIIITALPPPLTIIADGANVVLTWPAADTGFTTNGYRVESTTNLVPPVAWQTNSTPPIVISGQNVIISPISGSQQFFRLTQ